MTMRRVGGDAQEGGLAGGEQQSGEKHFGSDWKCSWIGALGRVGAMQE